MIRNDLTGKTFGEWKVLSLNSSGTNTSTKWNCQCSCGRTFIVASNSLTSGTTTKCKYCGNKRNRNYPPELRYILKGMKQRCYNVSCSSYKNYGAKGITICNEWLNNSNSFYQWAKPNYHKGLAIDRIDSSKGYSPENCRWVTQEENNRNRNMNYYATFNGITKTATEWCKELGLSPSTIHTRIRNGMTPEEAIMKPVNHNKARK